jgi:hypothetical protein
MEYLSKVVDFEKIESIAWLGWAKENVIVEDMCRNCPNLEKSDLYDLDTTKDERVIKWDINKKWDISGYDLVICFRTSLFAKNAQHFAFELGHLAAVNKTVVFDFMLPELRPLTNYASPLRKKIIETFRLPKNADAFLSWVVPIIRELRPEEYSDADKDAIKSHQKLHPFTQLTRSMFALGLKVRGPVEGGYSLMPKFDRIYDEFFREEVGTDYDRDSIIYVVQSPDVFLTEKMLCDNHISLCHPHFFCTFNIEPGAYQSLYQAPDHPEMWSLTLAVIERK